MPRGLSGNWIGNFASYLGAGDDGGNAGDEDAIADAIDWMFNMCGNAGQEAIIGKGLAAFESWAIKTLEGYPSYDGDYGRYVEMIISYTSYSAWFGSQMIWDEGYMMMSEQSYFHDGKPDVGGAGVEF